MEFKDYYATLGVPKTATEKEIKQAFRKLARKFHPDVNPGDKAVRVPVQVDQRGERGPRATRRSARSTTNSGANWRLYEQAQQAYAQNGAGTGGPAAARARSPGPTAGRAGRRVRGIRVRGRRRVLRRGQPFSDFFQTFFGGGDPGARPPRPRAARAAKKRQGHDVEQDVHLTLEEAYRGVTQRISIKHGGHARTVDVRIPAGIKDGARVRVASEGEPGAGGAPAGDLYLRVRLLPHPQFERRGQDLHARVPVPVATAVLGGQASITDPGRQGAAAAHPRDDAAGPGVPAARARHARARQARPGRRPLRHDRHRTAEGADRASSASTTRRWRAWRRVHGDP